MTQLQYKKDNQLSVPGIAKACFVSLGLLLIGSAVQAQSHCQALKAAADRIRADWDMAAAERNSLVSEAPSSEWCQAAWHADSLQDKWNEAYKNHADCLCSAGYCDGLIEEYALNVDWATKHKVITNEYCN